jgi:hypothetical protein
VVNHRTLQQSFIGPSPVHDLELALGQYQLYRSLLELSAPDRALHLAVSESVYTSFLSRPAVQLVLRRSQMAVLVVDAIKQEVVSWIS